MAGNEEESTDLGFITRVKGVLKMVGGLTMLHELPILGTVSGYAAAADCIMAAGALAAAGGSLLLSKAAKTPEDAEIRKNFSKQCIEFTKHRLKSAALTAASPLVYGVAFVADGAYNVAMGKNSGLMDMVHGVYRNHSTAGKIIGGTYDLVFPPKQKNLSPEAEEEQKRLLQNSRSVEVPMQQKNISQPITKNQDYLDALKDCKNFQEANEKFQQVHKPENRFPEAEKMQDKNGNTIITYADPKDPSNKEKNITYTMNPSGKLIDISAGKESNAIIPPIEDGNGGFIALRFKDGKVQHDSRSINIDISINGKLPSISTSSPSHNSVPHNLSSVKDRSLI